MVAKIIGSDVQIFIQLNRNYHWIMKFEKIPARLYKKRVMNDNLKSKDAKFLASQN